MFFYPEKFAIFQGNLLGSGNFWVFLLLLFFFFFFFFIIFHKEIATILTLSHSQLQKGVSVGGHVFHFDFSLFLSNY